MAPEIERVILGNAHLVRIDYLSGKSKMNVGDESRYDTSTNGAGW